MVEHAARWRGARSSPYVAADVYALPPHTSRGGWTWYTGSAGWMNPLMVQSVLRLALEVDRLRFTSCLPSTWKGSRWLPVPCDVLQHRRAMHRSGRRERVERDSRWRGTGGQRLSSRRRRPGAPRRGCVRQSGTRSLIDPGLTSCFPLAGIEMPPGTTVRSGQRAYVHRASNAYVRRRTDRRWPA